MEKETVMIADSRTAADFRSKTFSGYRRGQARSALRKSLQQCEFEPACYWGAELLCSLKPEDFWEEVIRYYAMSINTASINLAVYLAARTDDFKRIAESEADTQLRNNYDVRRILAEITGILILSRKRNPVHKGHRLTTNAFEIAAITPRLRATTSELGRKHMQKGDPSELYIAVNELAYHTEGRSGDIDLACYWIDWVFGYADAAKKAKKKLVVAARTWPAVQAKHSTDPAWLLWDCIRSASHSAGTAQSRAVEALSIIYCLKFTDGARQRRKQLLYIALAIVIEPPRHAPPLCSNPKKLSHIKNKIDLVYAQIRDGKPDVATLSRKDTIANVLA